MDTGQPIYDAQRRHESPDVGAAAARMIRALVVRASDGDTEALEQLAALEQLIPVAVQLAGHEAHKWGYSFTALGNLLGISRQAARARFMALPLAAEWPYSWPMDWWQKRASSASIMRTLVGQLAARREAGGGLHPCESCGAELDGDDPSNLCGGCAAAVSE